MRPHSRGAARPGFAFISISRPKEGAGNAGRPMRPIAACAMVEVERTRVSQVTPESPGTPRAMVYGLYRALPGDRAFLPPSLMDRSTNLTPASGCQDHTTLPSAGKRPRLWHHLRPPHPAPTSVTIAKRPSVWDGTKSLYACFYRAVKRNSEIQKLGASPLWRIPDSRRTSPHLRKVPIVAFLWI